MDRLKVRKSCQQKMESNPLTIAQIGLRRRGRAAGEGGWTSTRAFDLIIEPYVKA
jgi:hypothetical protein